MTLSVVWTLSMAASVLYACYSGTADLLTAAITDGIADAVDFCMGAGAMMVFWCGLFGIMEEVGLAGALEGLLRPLLRRLFPRAAGHREAFSPLCANVTANLLGLGNAATPMGIRAAQELSKLPHAQQELATLVVMNTASIQLLPTTVAALRSAQGCATPFDILPCVLLTSVLSVTAGLITVRLFCRL